MPDLTIAAAVFYKRLGEVALVELGIDQIAEALETIDRTPATRNRYRAAIHRLLTVAVREWRWIDHNPASGVKRRKENNRRDVVFSKDDEEQLLAACEKADPRGRLPLLFRLGLATGARAGELIGLTWGDLDLAAGTARLGRTKNNHPRLGSGPRLHEMVQSTGSIGLHELSCQYLAVALQPPEVPIIDGRTRVKRGRLYLLFFQAIDSSHGVGG